MAHSVLEQLAKSKRREWDNTQTLGKHAGCNRITDQNTRMAVAPAVVAAIHSTLEILYVSSRPVMYISNELAPQYHASWPSGRHIQTLG